MIRQSLLAALLIGATPALAQTTPPATPPDVTVTGRRPSDLRTATEHVQSISLRTDGQIARFHADVCPTVMGLPPAHSDIIVDRIRADALAAGAGVGKPGCAPNVLIVVSDDSLAFVNDVRKRRPGWFAGMSDAQMKHVFEDAGPVRAWNSTLQLSEDGRAASTAPAQFGDTSVLAGQAVLRVDSASFIHQPTRQDITASFVAFDKAALVGKSLTQIADYVAMRTLARTRVPAGEGAIGTILTLFSPGAPPAAELTGADSDYLRSIYRSPATANVNTQFNRSARRIAAGGK